MIVFMIAEGLPLDPRARRTLKALEDALGTLMQTKQLSDISVAEICRVAGVHRTTFYKHFDSVSELAGMAVTDLVDRILGEGSQVVTGEEESAQTYSLWFTALVEHVAQRRETYRSILGEKGDPGLQHALAQKLIARAEASLHAGGAARQNLGVEPLSAALMMGNASYGAIVSLTVVPEQTAEETAQVFLATVPESWRTAMDAAPVPPRALRDVPRMAAKRVAQSDEALTAAQV